MLRIVACVTAALAALASLAQPVSGLASSPIVRAADDVGDVRLIGDSSTTSPAQEQSVDLRRLVVTHYASGVRFALTLRSVLPSQDTYLQALAVHVFAPRNTDQVWDLTVSATPQHPGGVAYFSPTLDADDHVRCTVGVSTAGRTVRLDVPADCLPADPGVVRASATLKVKHHRGLRVSMDDLRVPGRVRLS